MPAGGHGFFFGLPFFDVPGGGRGKAKPRRRGPGVQGARGQRALCGSAVRSVQPITTLTRRGGQAMSRFPTLVRLYLFEDLR